MLNKISLFLLLTAIFFLFIFTSLVTDKYDIAAPVLENVLRLVLSAFMGSELKLFAWGALIAGLAGSVCTFYLVNSFSEDQPKIIRGTRIVDSAVLAKMTKGK